MDSVKTDPMSITVVVDVEHNEFYQLSTKVGVLKQMYKQNPFISCSKEFEKVEEVVKDKAVSHREVAGKLSLTGNKDLEGVAVLKNAERKNTLASHQGYFDILNAIIVRLVVAIKWFFNAC
nr:unnamed protein product [Callosobruchus analis]